MDQSKFQKANILNFKVPLDLLTKIKTNVAFCNPFLHHYLFYASLTHTSELPNFES